MQPANHAPPVKKPGVGRLLFALAMTLLAWAGIWIANTLPYHATYSLTVQTERIELDVLQSPSPLGWSGLDIVQIDGAPATCSIRTLPIGSLPLKIIITAPSRRLPNAATAVTYIDVRPLGNESRLALHCSDGVTREVKTSAVFTPSPLGPPMTLMFAGNVTAGASPDSQGGESHILLSGSLRATEKLKGSKSPGPSNQYDFFAGDRVIVAGEHPETVAATGLIWSDEEGLRLVAHATRARIMIDRPGVGKLEEITLRPGLLAVLLANPTWFLLTTMLAMALTFLPTVEQYLLRARAVFSRESPAKNEMEN